MNWKKVPSSFPSSGSWINGAPSTGSRKKDSLRLDLNGNPIGIYGILRDVTERKRVEDAIDIANKKLNLMNQITRHDILNTITGLLRVRGHGKGNDFFGREGSAAR